MNAKMERVEYWAEPLTKELAKKHGFMEEFEEKRA